MVLLNWYHLYQMPSEDQKLIETLSIIKTDRETSKQTLNQTPPKDPKLVKTLKTIKIDIETS